MFAFLIARGHTLYDLKNTYTIRQVSLFYRYAVAEDLHEVRLSTQGFFVSMQAIIGSAFGGRGVGQQAIKNYQEFIDSLDLDMVQKKKENARRMARNPMGLLAMLGVRAVGETGDSSE